MHAIVYSADVQDRDGGYQGERFQTALKSVMRGLKPEIVKRSDQAKNFVVLSKRWIVERTFAWLNRCRRLALAFLKLASIRVMLRKLRNPT